MSSPETKISQYLDEAHAAEVALTRVLQAQIAMAPRGEHRTSLEQHLGQTQDHARRTRDRLRELGHGGNPVQALTGIAQTIAGQAIALSKTPFDLVRGSGGEEKVLKNAKDSAAAEALEIATYLALEHLAREAGDDVTADLAASIRAEEEEMLRTLLRDIPRLTGLVVGAEINGDPTYDLAQTGAADMARGVKYVAETEVKKTAKKATTRAKRTARQTRKVPGVARAEGAAKGAVASEGDLPIARYDALNADEIVAKLPELSQIDLAKVAAYEAKNDNRKTVTDRVSALQGKEPWPGYDEQTVEEITTALDAASDAKVSSVRTYERAHKDRAGVVAATERELAGSSS